MDTLMIIPYFYQYTVGSIVFFGGLLVAHRTGALDLKSREARQWFTILLVGMGLFASLHALLQFVFPFVGV